MSKMIDIEVHNAISKFGSQISTYKQDRDFLKFCLVNKARILSVFTFVIYWCKFLIKYNFLLLIIEFMKIYVS